VTRGVTPAMRPRARPPVDFSLVLWLLLVAFALFMWLVMIRPQQRRQRELVRMQSALEPGDEVMLTSGIYGVLRELDEDAGTIRVEIADGVVMKVARQAIAQLVKDDAPAEQDDESTEPVELEKRQDSTTDGDSEVSEEN
jgi:preprotein translocase subunit YajC